MHAAELYTKPMKCAVVTVGTMTFELKKGLISTVTALDKLPDAIIKAAAAILTNGRRISARLSRDIIGYHISNEWYRAHDVEAPASITDKYAELLKEATMEPVSSAEPQPAAADGSTPVDENKPKVRRGARAYCFQRIQEGAHKNAETGAFDEQAILNDVKTTFPDQRFTMADVRWQMREAGVLPRTQRFGAKNRPAEHPAAEHPAAE